jgi:1-deoxy-D-xylulose-5-phosphate synthase
MWDMSILRIVPGIRIAAPRDAATLSLALREAVGIDDCPTVIRFPKGAVNAQTTAIGRTGSVDILHQDDDATVLLISVGVFAPLCLDVAARLADQGIGVTVVDPRWVVPVSPDLVSLAAQHQLVVTVEDNIRTGGIGSAISAALRANEVDVPCRDIGIEPRFLEHGNRAGVLATMGLTAQDVSRTIVETMARFDSAHIVEASESASNVSETDQSAES